MDIAFPDFLHRLASPEFKMGRIRQEPVLGVNDM